EVKAASDLQADLLHRCRDRHRGAHAICGLGEGGEEPVAGRVFFVTPMAFELRPDDLPERAQELAPAPVTELGGDPRGVDDVQEQNGCEASARRSARHRLKYRRVHNVEVICALRGRTASRTAGMLALRP